MSIPQDYYGLDYSHWMAEHFNDVTPVTQGE